MCNENGGTVDDLIVYKRSDDHYFIVVNAANKDKDYQWMLAHQSGEVTFTDVSDQYGQIALQGPKAMEILRKLTTEENIPKKYYHAVFGAEVAGMPCIVSKTGYTGEDGVEIYLASDLAEKMWETLLEAGKEEGLIPCGLGVPLSSMAFFPMNSSFFILTPKFRPVSRGDTSSSISCP